MTHQPLTQVVLHTLRDSLPGVLGKSWEPRAGQSDMASAVAAVIETGGVEVIEAETGLGKSLAYLIPILHHCRRTGARAVVSTYTRNLQRQLIDKDFALAGRAAGVDVRGVSLMGRGNYLCRRRAGSRIGRGRGRSDVDPGVARFLRSALADESGELDALAGASRYLDGAMRFAVSSPQRDAVCAGCDSRGDCFMLRARRRALDAQVVVTNHALLFSDLALSGALLGPFDVLVVDEAHHLEDVATDFFSISYSPRSIRGASQSVYSPELEETVRYISAMVEADDKGDAREVDEAWKSFHAALDDAEEHTKALFATLGANAARGGGAGNGQGAADVVQVVYREGAPLLYGADSPAAGVSHAMARLESAAAAVLDVAGECKSLAESGAAGAMKAVRDTAAETRAEFEFLLSAAADDHVFYARVGGPGVQALTASPVDVSARLGDVLEEDGRATVLTSATLAVDGDFSFTLERLGLDGGGASTKRYESSFDIDGSRLVLLPDDVPAPNDPAFLPAAAGLIEDAVVAGGRRALVLCTARGQVSALGRLLSPSPQVGGELFLQTAGASREELLERFRGSRRGVLAGLASFWEGIDLPGADLELLIILKLPFMVPSEPVTRARAARLEEVGENPFEKLFIPDVVLKLRQGMGRLIRTSRDSGAVIILDRRLVHSRYGGQILRAVTNRSVRCAGREDTLLRLTEHFRKE